jgi:hypothetical protein
MMFKFVTVGLAYTAAFAAAFTAPKLTGDPSGNAITSPGLEELVPAGEPYTIIWDPSTAGPVTLYFLKGPSTNAVPQYAIAEHIANSGSYDWTPSTSLAPAAVGYGLLLVDDVTGAYQYSTQFGIKNDKYASGSAVDTTTTKAGATSSAVTKTSVTSYAVTAAATTLPTTTASAYDDGSDDDETSIDDAATTTCSTTLTKPTLAPTTAVVTTKAAASGNSTAPTLRTTTASASSTQSTGPAAATGAAVRTVASSFAGLVFAAGVAVLAL